MGKNIWNGRLGDYRFGLLFNLPSLWVGVHYSQYNRRYCINIVPTITLWVSLPGGKVPEKGAYK